MILRSSEKRICWISLGGRRQQNLHGKPRHSIIPLPHFPHSAGGSWAYWKPEVCNGPLICLQTYITDAADRFYHVPHRIFEFTFYPTMPAEYVLTNDAPPPLPGIVGLLQSPFIAIGLKLGFRELPANAYPVVHSSCKGRQLRLHKRVSWHDQGRQYGRRDCKSHFMIANEISWLNKTRCS